MLHRGGRLRRERGQTLLEVDLPGFGRFAAWPAQVDNRGVATVQVRGPGYDIPLKIFTRPWGLDLRILGGTIDTFSGPLPLKPTQVSVLAGPHAIPRAN